MAIIYTAINGTLAPLRARIYADGVDIHTARLEMGDFTPPHPLRGCTTFQWQFNDQTSAGWVDLTGPMAISDTWQVDTSNVANSGAYRCIIQVGEDPDCRRITDERLFAIIDCQDVSPITFPGTGGNGSRTISILFPHFVRDRVVITSPDWVTHEDIVCARTAGVCDEVSTLTAARRAENTARNGYVDVQIGDFLCAYPIQQDYVRNVPDVPPPTPPAPADTTPPVGPRLVIANLNPTVVVDATASLLVTADIANPDGTFSPIDGDPNWQITQDGVTALFYDPGTDIFNPRTPPRRPYYNWLNQFETDINTQRSSIGIVLDTSTAGTKTVSITATGNTVSVTDTDSVEVQADATDTQAGAVSGDTFGSGSARPGSSFERQVQQQLLFGPQRMLTNRFSVDGGTATLRIRLNSITGLNQSFPYTGNAEFRVRLQGPSAPNGDTTRMYTLAAGEPGSILDPNRGNMFEIPAADFTTRSDGRLGPGAYTITIEVTSAGGRPGQRVINAVFNPNFSYSVFPFFNFGF